MPAALMRAHPATASRAFSLVHFTQLEEAPAAAETDSVPCVLSLRVGAEIDRDERRYFHLFPYMKRFEKTIAFRRSTGEFAFVITRRDTAGLISDTTIIVGAETAEQLAILVDNYEPICSRKRYFDYRIIEDYAGLPAVSCTTTRPVRITLTDGTEYMAQILHAADSVLILWIGDGVYDWRTIGENAVSVPCHMIQAVTYKESAVLKRGLTCGLGGCLIGGAAGALLGLVSGDDPEGQWFFAYTAEQKAFYGGLGCGLFGGAAGGLIGIIGGAGESRLIRGSYQTYQHSLPSLNRHAVFPYSVPPEIKYLPEVRHSSTGQ